MTTTTTQKIHHIFQKHIYCIIFLKPCQRDYICDNIECKPRMDIHFDPDETWNQFQKINSGVNFIN